MIFAQLRKNFNGSRQSRQKNNISIFVCSQTLCKVLTEATSFSKSSTESVFGVWLLQLLSFLTTLQYLDDHSLHLYLNNHGFLRSILEVMFINILKDSRHLSQLWFGGEACLSLVTITSYSLKSSFLQSRSLKRGNLSTLEKPQSEKGDVVGYYSLSQSKLCWEVTPFHRKKTIERSID